MRDVKKLRKRVEKCIFCGENDKVVLDVHRINEGYKGGEYTLENSLTTCSNCHRRVHHSGRYKIDGWVMTTGGLRLHCWIDEEEQYLKR